MATKKPTKKTTTKNTTATETQGTEQQGAAPLNVIAQYVKDISFENPGVKLSSRGDDRPDIAIHVETHGEKFEQRGDRAFEVSLRIRVDAKQKNDQLFLMELDYAGVFEIGADVPEQYLHPIIMVECPRILFPFARSIVATTIQEGGYPSLLLTPVDFAALYQQQVMKQQAEKEAAAK